MRALEVRELKSSEKAELEAQYRKTKDVRIRTRTQMILLAVEQKLNAGQIGEIVRQDEQTVRRWIKRFNAEGVNGLLDAPRTGAPSSISEVFRARVAAVVRQRPRSLDQPYSLWTLQRLADFMAEETGQRVSSETIRRILKDHDIVLSRPQHTISSPDPEYKVKKKRLKKPETT
jgi:transposase